LGRGVVSDVGQDDRVNGGWWDWHAVKAAAGILWRAGVCVVGARAFKAMTAERVIDGGAFCDAWAGRMSKTSSGCCGGAGPFLGFAHGRMACVLGHILPREGKCGVTAGQAAGRIGAGSRWGADGTLIAAMPSGSAATGRHCPPRGCGCSPFEPAVAATGNAPKSVRVCYGIEMFVPAPNGVYGSMCSSCKGERSSPAVDMKAHRDRDTLGGKRLWQSEARVGVGTGRV